MISAHRKTFGMMFLSFSNIFLQFINFTLMTKSLSVVDFTDYRVFISIISLSGVFHLGYVDGLTMRWVLDNNKPLLRELLVVISITLITSISLIFYHPLSTYIYYVISLVIIYNICSFVNSLYLKNNLFFPPLIFVFLNLVSLFFFLCLNSKRMTMNSVFLCILLSNLILTLIPLFIAIKKKYIQRTIHKWSITFTDMILSVKTGGPVLLIGLFFQSVFTIDKVILSQFYNKQELGFYSFASSCVGIIAGIFMAPANLIFKKFASFNDLEISAFYRRAFWFFFAGGILTILTLPVMFDIVATYIPNYNPSRKYLIGFSFLLFPSILLQLIVFNVYKRYKSSGYFLKIAAVSLFLIIITLFSAGIFSVGIQHIPFILSQIFVLCVAVTEIVSWYTIPNFKRGKTERFLLILIYNLILIACYAIWCK